MAEANPSPDQEYVSIPIEVRMNPNGTQTIHFPDISRLNLDFTSNDNRNDHSFDLNLGYANEAWIVMQRRRLEYLYRDILHRMITAYYGLLPDDCPEYLIFNYVCTTFDHILTLAIKRDELAERLVELSGKPECEAEYKVRFEQLKRVNLKLPELVSLVCNQCYILENFFELPRYVKKQNPEVEAYLKDLERHADFFRESAWDERTEAMKNRAEEK